MADEQLAADPWFDDRRKKYAPEGLYCAMSAFEVEEVTVTLANYLVQKDPIKACALICYLASIYAPPLLQRQPIEFHIKSEHATEADKG